MEATHGNGLLSRLGLARDDDDERLITLLPAPLPTGAYGERVSLLYNGDLGTIPIVSGDKAPEAENILTQWRTKIKPL